MLLSSSNTNMFLIYCISYIVKTYAISRGNGPIWDESHFGKFAYKYLDGEFYFDVHPPLGKMLTALGGWLSNQKEANYDYAEYREYPNTYDYTLNRSFHAASGSFIPVFGYLILRLFGLTKRKSFLGSLLLIFDTGMTMICKIIVLDSHMLAFTALTSYLMARFHYAKTARERNLIMPFLGLSLGCTVSIKWIGCLTTVFLGAYIIYHLLVLFYTEELKVFIKQFLLCTVSLIVLPAITYLCFFMLHFSICKKASADSGSFTKEFNYRLSNNPYENSMKYVSYGRQVTLKFNTGYLHSHPHAYPDYLNSVDMEDEEYKKHLQVTCYKPRDENNVFYIQRIGEEKVTSFVKYGEEVAILHSETKGYLTIENMEAFTTKAIRVTGYKGSVRESSIFIIEKASEKETGENIEICKVFRLKHKLSGKYLKDSTEDLPTWGYSQSEVIGSGVPDSNCDLYVEENKFSDKENNSLIKFDKRFFLWDFLELHGRMYTTNKSLTTSRELEPHAIESFPYQWFILSKGIRLVGWENVYRFYLLMNPALLYSTSVSVFYTLYAFATKLLRHKRRQFEQKTKVTDLEFIERYGFQFYFSIGGFIFHYAPFFLVGRVMYLHHYFPAYFFLIIGMAVNMKNWRYFPHYVLLIIGFYVAYSPLCYGLLREASMKKLQLLSSWNF